MWPPGILFGDRVVVYEDTLIFEDKLNGVRCVMARQSVGTAFALLHSTRTLPGVK